MRLHQRILLILLTVIMLVSLVPATVTAEEYDLLETRKAAEGELPLWKQRAAAGTGTYTVTTGVLNVRASATTDSARIGKVYAGDQVVVSEVKGIWGKISYNGSVGWICLDYAQLNAPKQYSLSSEGLALIKKFEGYRQYKYWDYNHYSIGYGSTCGAQDYPNGISEPEASALLSSSLVTYEVYLDSFIGANGITLSQSEYDALVSFTYNLGDPWNRYDSFKLKTILKNGTENYGAAEIYEAFGQFVKAGGNVLPGLVTRRNAEAALFLKNSKTLKFMDVKSVHWYFDAVSACVKKGIMSGVSDTAFNPTSNLTRGQMVALLGQMSGIDRNAYKTSSFSDVPTSSWFAPYVQWAYEKKIVSGTGEGKFSPNANLTRQDMVVMLYNYAKFNGINTSGAGTELYKSFKDASKLSSYAIEAMNWAIHTKCISGDNGYLNPTNYAIRAQVAQVANSFHTNILKK